MTRRFAGARGLSLVEVTIMLLVLMTLTGVLAPSIMDFVHDAQWVKAKEDCDAIGVSVVRLMRDVGPCLKFNGRGSCTKDNRVDLLYSNGPDVAADDVGGEASAGFDGAGTTASALNWHSDSARGDSMEHQLVDNGGGADYPAPADLSTDLFAGPGADSRLAGRLRVLAHRPRPLGTPLPRELRVPGRGPRRRRRQRRGTAKRRLVARRLLHLGRPERPVRNALRRERRVRRASPGRRHDLHHFRGHAVRWHQPAPRRP